MNRPILYTRGVGPLGRSKDWTASKWTKGKMESEHPGGKSGSELPFQDREVRRAGRDGRVEGS
jgi:hypothetical protein